MAERSAFTAGRARTAADVAATTTRRSPDLPLGPRLRVIVVARGCVRGAGSAAGEPSTTVLLATSVISLRTTRPPLTMVVVETE
jgi:hypothetical protein